MRNYIIKSNNFQSHQKYQILENNEYSIKYVFNLLGIFIFATKVYNFDVNFISEETNGQLIIYGKIDIDCPKNVLTI